MGFFKSYRRGVNDGLKTSGEGSGFVLGFFFPILVTIMILGGLAAWWGGCFKKKAPAPCRGYSYDVGVISSREMSCNRWPAMTMRVEKPILRSKIVHCRCTAESFPAERH